MFQPTKKQEKTKIPLWYHTRRKTNIPLAKQGFNTTGCPLCKCIITLFDEQRSETCCADCGYVYDETAYENNEYTQHSTSEMYIGSSYTHQEKKFLKYKNKKPILFVKEKERRHQYYSHVIQTMKFDLAMTQNDTRIAQQIITNCTSLKQFHSTLSAETIILGICRFVVKQKKCVSAILRFKNKIYKEYNLTKKEYNVIEKNIKEKISEDVLK